ncbi:MAG TPA: hypothetical protein VIW23_08580 [Candidatus Acidoferrum sp.]|jgi:hypothetical protein
MSSHDSFVASGNSPTAVLCRDCWLTLDGVVLIEKGKQHRDYFVPEGAKASKHFGLDLGYVRVSTLGTNGSVLYFEFKQLSPVTSRLIIDAIDQSRAERINLECHVPQYTQQLNLSPQDAISFLKQVPTETAHLDLVFENYLSLFLIRPCSEIGQHWLDENVGNEDTLTFGRAIVCEPRYVEAILRGAIEAGLAVQS